MKERGFLPDWRIIAGLCVLILGAILLMGILWSFPSIKAAESLTTLFMVIIGTLIVIAALPRIQDFKIGKEGFEAQFVTRQEFDKKLEKHQQMMDEMFVHFMLHIPEQTGQ